jgi:hypothetical protein
MSLHTISSGRILGTPLGLDYSKVSDFWFAHLDAGRWRLPSPIQEMAFGPTLDRRRGNSHHAFCERVAIRR